MKKLILISMLVMLVAALAPGLWASGSGGRELELVLPLALIGIGIFLLFLEFGVIPGFGLAGISGILLLGLGLFLGAQRIVAIQMEVSEASVFAIISGVVASISGCTLFTFGMFKVMPLMPGVRKMIHRDALKRDTSAMAKLKSDENLVGHSGTAQTDLRPSGKVNISGQVYDVTTSDGYVNAGEQVYVEKVHEGHFVVRRLV